MPVRANHRTWRQAFKYWKPYRLTISSNPPIYAWLWWNYRWGYGQDETKSFKWSFAKWLWGWRIMIFHPKLYGWYINNIRHEWKWRGVEWWHRY